MSGPDSSRYRTSTLGSICHNLTPVRVGEAQQS